MTDKKILVVEDHPEHLYFFRKVLGDAGYHVVEAESAENGLALAFDERPDLIILDLVLHDSSGWDAAKVLKSDPRTASVPVFLVTAFPARASEQWSADGECDALLVKPIEPQRMIAEVKRWI